MLIFPILIKIGAVDQMIKKTNEPGICFGSEPKFKVSSFSVSLCQGFASEQNISGTGSAVAKPGTGECDYPFVPRACRQPMINFRL